MLLNKDVVSTGTCDGDADDYLDDLNNNAPPLAPGETYISTKNNGNTYRTDKLVIPGSFDDTVLEEPGMSAAITAHGVGSILFNPLTGITYHIKLATRIEKIG